MDPDTLAFTRVGGADGSVVMQRASAAIRVGSEVWVGSNQDRKILWLVGPDDVATAREVVVGQKLGRWAAVQATDATRPLTAADRVVVRGLQRCREGKPVVATAAPDASLDVAGLVVPQPRPAPPEPPAPPASASPPAAVAPPPEPTAAEPQSPAEPAIESLPAPGETPR